MTATLSQEVRKDGFTLTCICRRGHLAVYRQHWSWSRTDEYDAYEVIVIRSRPERSIFGRIIGASECYPSPGEWGIYGFTLPDRDRAFAKLKELQA